MSIDTRQKLGCFKGHEDQITEVKFIEDASKIVSAFCSGIIVWDWQINQSPYLLLRGNTSSITGLALNSDESTLFSLSSGCCSLKIWDMSTGMLWASFRYKSTVLCASVSPKELVVAGQLDGTIRVVNWVSDAIICEDLKRKKGRVMSIEFSSDGLYLVAIYDYKRSKRWNTTTWETVTEEMLPFSARLISTLVNGETAILDDRAMVCIGDFGTFDMTLTARYGLSFSAVGLGLRKSGNELIAGYEDGVFHIWNANIRLKSRDSFQDVDEDEGFVEEFAFSANWKRVVSLSKNSKHYLWDAQTGKEISFFNEPDIGTQFAMSPDGNMLASSSQNCIFLWSADHPMAVQCYLDSNLPTGTQSAKTPVPQICFSPDGKLIPAYALKHIEIWDICTRSKKRDVYIGFHAFRFSFSSDGRYIICAGSEVEILEVETGTAVFKRSETDQQMILQDAKAITRQCTPMANMLWQFPVERHELNMCSVRCACCSLDVDYILNFVPFDERFRFCLA